MPSVGYATLQVIPSVRGIGDELRRQLVRPAGDAGGDAGEAAGGGLKDKLKVGAAAAGVAAGALLVAGLSEAMEQADLTRTLQAQLGATGKDAARYGKIAGQLYAKGITEDVAQGAEVIRSIVNAGLVPPDATNKQLKSIAAQMADVSNTFGTDMSMQTQAVSALMKNGLAPNAKGALDVITVGMQKLGPNAEDLLETFQEYPIQLKKLGLDSKTALGLFQQGLQGGARDTDIVADALKEFSIRSIDMSDSSRAAYKSLGLDAKTLEKQIGQGGASATAGLQTVLDKLRSIHDPVKREAAAVGLFGTQAEELGTSLFKLDPGKASKGFGDVSGAAAKLGTTLRQGPSYEIKVFTRTLRQGLVNVLGTYVIPQLTTVGQAGKAAFAWARDNQSWLLPLGAGLGIVAAAIGAYVGAVKVAALVTRAWSAAQVLFNAVLSANPIGLIVVGLVALGTALVVAYQKSETFRAIVQAAWAGIKSAASAAWTGFIKPALDGFMTGLRAIGTAATWLWTTVLSPTFSVIGTAARILATILGVVLIGPTVVAVKLLGATVSWLWKNAIGPVFGWIKAGASLLWAAVKVQFNGFKAGLQQLGAAFSWLWRNAVSPVFGWIKKGAAVLWTAVKLQFGYFQSGLRALGSVVSWLWKTAVSPAWSGIKTVVSGAWNTGIKPVFNTMKSAVKAVGASFNTAKNAIATAWGKVSGIAKKPVEFVIDTVYNKGLVGVWNKVASAFGAPKLETFKGFAKGGVLPGYTPGRDVHLAALSGGEAVMRPEWTRAVGPGYVHSMNRAARSGGVSGVQKALGLPAFADGGIFGWIKKGGSTLKGWGSSAWDKVKEGASWLKDTLAGSARAGVQAVVNPLIAAIPGTGSAFGRMAKRVPSAMVDALFGYADEADKKGASAPAFGGKIPTGQHLAVINAALRAARIPPPGSLGQWQAGLNTLITRESNWNASAINRWDTNALMGMPSQGLAQTIPGTFNAYVPKSLRSRGILDPVANVAAAARYIVSRYGDITRVQQANPNRPPAGYDSGGWLQPGLSTVVNKTGRPEAVLTAGQWDAVQRGMTGGGPSYHYEINARTADFTVADLERVQRVQEARARVGRPR